MIVIGKHVLQAEAGTESDGGATGAGTEAGTGTEAGAGIPSVLPEKTGGVVPFQPSSSEAAVGLFKKKAEREAALALELQQQEHGGADIPSKSPLSAAQRIQDSNDLALASIKKGEKEGPSNMLDASSLNHVYGGKPVKIENSPEIINAFADKKLDLNKVNGELFSEKGLSFETRTALNAAFGEGAVNMYLEGWKNKNDAMVEKSNLQNERTNIQIDNIIKTESHGKLSEVMKWASDNLQAKEYEEYRTIINGNDPSIIRFAMRDLARRSGVNTSPASPAKNPPLIEGNIRNEGGEGLSQAEYHALFTSGKYKGKEAYYDNLRLKGQRAGK